MSCEKCENEPCPCCAENCECRWPEQVSVAEHLAWLGPQGTKAMVDDQAEEEAVEVPPPIATRALLRCLGYDPAAYSIWVVQHPIPGIRVIDQLNEPVKFFAERALKKLGNSDAWCEEYAAAIEAETVAAREAAH